MWMILNSVTKDGFVNALPYICFYLQQKQEPEIKQHKKILGLVHDGFVFSKKFSKVSPLDH